MDKFVVDIDAVLDEFEESENKIQPQIAQPLPQIKQQKASAASVTASLTPTEVPAAPSPPPPATSPALESKCRSRDSEDESGIPDNAIKLNGNTDVTKVAQPKPMESCSSPAVKPKTPLKTQQSPSSNKSASPGVSSEQFEEFLRKKSIENAHLLSAHNSPVLQRYRTSSVGLSVKPASTPLVDRPKSVERTDVLPKSVAVRTSTPDQAETSDLTDAPREPTSSESRSEQAEKEAASSTKIPNPELLTETIATHPEQRMDPSTEPQSCTESSFERTPIVHDGPVEASDDFDGVPVNHSGAQKQTAKDDSVNHGALKSDASNFYRIVSFDMSAVEVTDDDLHLLEDEVQNDRAPSRRSQDSEASLEPVDPDQIMESEAAENVVNNNSSDALNPPDDLDNPFDVPKEARERSPDSTGDRSSGTLNGDASTALSTATHDVEVDKSSPDTPHLDSTAPEQEAAVNSDDAEPGAVGGEPEPVVAPSEGVLGKVRPMWIHDEDAPICMNCGQDFTMFRRRHHCRACGKVLCGNCCKDRARLQFMDGELARVCSYCIEILNKAQLPPPTVMVPVGVLKKGGEKSNTSGNGLGGSSGCSKSVMFSDGIRPGGDLTDLDIPSTPPAQRAPQRTLKQLATGRSKAVVARKYRKYVSVTDSLGCLPNVLLSTKFRPYDQPLPAGTLFNLLQDPTLPPVSFELTRHKVQLRVKIVTLDCCLGSRVWSFCSEGLAAFGQEEVAFILEYHADDELAVPRDVLKLYKILYENACRGAPVIQMDHLLFPGGLLGSNEHAGVLFLRTTLQCTQNILMPLHENNYLVAMLIMRSEVPWAKLFPLRLLLRLGAELRYYPCPLVSQRFRKAVYFDGDQHSIMSILADFRNYQYTIQNIPGLVIHVVGKTYTIKAPRNRYDLMMKASTTNENILAIGSNFSSSADSHLVCIQGEDGSFQSQTINIASLPVKVTGASFLVFSGALKSNSGYTAKSSIVEDGILVQIGPHEMAKLKQAIHAMENYRIVCKETKPTTENIEAPEEEYVELIWVENEVTRNESVVSVVDGSSMAGIPSCKIFSGTDYSNDKFVIRWTELFFLASKDTELDLPDPNRLIEATARSMCVALLPHAAKLYEQDLKKVALRISLDPEQFGYELGAGGQPLNGDFLCEVDNALVPIITSLDGSHQPMTIELVFYVLLK